MMVPKRRERVTALSIHALLVCAVVGRAWSLDTAQKESQIITFVPKVSLINGIDDVDPANGKCVPEAKQLCGKVKPGEGRLADCLTDHIAETPDSEGASSVSDACREELYQYRILRGTNINFNVPLAKACKADAERLCNTTWFFGYQPGQVIACLREMKDQSLAPACKEQVIQVQLHGTIDYRADAKLYAACKDDAASVCKGVKLGGGRVQACLREKRLRLSWKCDEQLFRQEVEMGGDARLSTWILLSCGADKRKFCSGVEPGSAEMMDCLVEHRNSEGFSASCKKEVDDALRRRVRDFRIDSRLRTACANDTYNLCAFYGDLDDLDSASVVQLVCLRDHVEVLTSPTCQQQVRKYQQLAAEDVRFNPTLADACYDEYAALCARVAQDSAHVMACLSNVRAKLSSDCRSALFAEEVRFSSSIDYQLPMRQACAAEVKRFCKDVPHGEARVIRCLQEHKGEKEGFSKQCRDEVKAYEAKAASDYRLNYRLAKSCKADIDKLCAGVCTRTNGQACDGGDTVLRCLRDKREELTSGACKQEVSFLDRMEAEDLQQEERDPGVIVITGEHGQAVHQREAA